MDDENRKIVENIDRQLAAILEVVHGKLAATETALAVSEAALAAAHERISDLEKIVTSMTDDSLDKIINGVARAEPEKKREPLYPPPPPFIAPSIDDLNIEELNTDDGEDTPLSLDRSF